MLRILNKYIELIFWIVALILLAAGNIEEHHFTFCPIANLGFDWCPGCGLGRSITALFHGELMESFRFHFMGIPAVLVIFHRIYSLVKNTFFNQYKFIYKEI